MRCWHKLGCEQSKSKEKKLFEPFSHMLWHPEKFLRCSGVVANSNVSNIHSWLLIKIFHRPFSDMSRALVGETT